MEQVPFIMIRDDEIIQCNTELKENTQYLMYDMDENKWFCGILILTDEMEIGSEVKESEVIDGPIQDILRDFKKHTTTG